MNATTHPFAPEEIMAFLDGETTADRSQTISTHIDSCAECRTLSQKLQNTHQNLFSWKVGALSPRFETYFRSTAKNPRLFERSFIRKLLHPDRRTKARRMIGLAAAGAFALLLFAVSIPTLHRSREAAQLAAEYGSWMGKVAPGQRGPQSHRVGGDVSTALEKTKKPLSANAVLEQRGQIQTAYDRSEDSVSVDDAEVRDQQSVSFAQPMIARTVSLAVVTKDFEASRKSLDTILARHNGYSAQLNVTTPQGSARSLQASLRIPAPQLTTAVAELKSLGRVESENQNGEEVTQEHADLVARLKNSRETEQRLQAILAQRTGKIKDVLAVEQEIARVRGEIEQMEAERKDLEHRVDFATVDLKLSEEYKAQLSSPAPSVSTLLRNALISGLRTAADSVLSLALFFSESGPVVLLWLAILAIPARQLWRRYRRAAAAI